MVRQCHSNTCPVGVCTQDKNLRAKFTGTPEKVVNLFTFIAEEVREILAELGFKRLNDIIGRNDLLKQVSRGTSNLDDLDLSPLLVQADPGENKRYSLPNIINKISPNLDEKIYEDIKNQIKKNDNIIFDYKIKNVDRAIGTRLSHYIYKKFGKDKIIVGLVFLTYFGIRFGIESRKRTEALNRLELILAKEHELESIGLQAAAAAHFVVCLACHVTMDVSC